MPRPPRFKSATKAPHSSAVNTAGCSGRRHCGTSLTYVRPAPTLEEQGGAFALACSDISGPARVALPIGWLGISNTGVKGHAPNGYAVVGESANGTDVWCVGRFLCDVLGV